MSSPLLIVQRVLLATYVFLCSVLVSGSFYGLPVKLFVLLLLSFSLSISLFKAKSVKTSSAFLLISIFLVLVSSMLVGLADGFLFIRSAVDQLVTILSLAATIAVILYSVNTGVVSVGWLLSTLLYSTIVACVIKIGLEIALITNSITLIQLRSYMQEAFGAEPITLTLPGGLYRLNITNDWLIPPVAIYLGLNRKINGLFKAVLWTLILIAVILTYSRLIWLLFIISILSIFMINYSNKRIYIGYSLVSLLVLVVIFFSVGVTGRLAPVIQALMERYVGESASFSDRERYVMFDKLFPMFADRPLLGNGLGSHPIDYIRFPESPWLYELQWLHLLTQFGLLGTAILFICLVCTLWVHIIKLPFLLRYILSFNLVFWMSTGLANSFLITSVSGLVFTFYPLLALFLIERNKAVGDFAVKMPDILSY